MLAATGFGSHRRVTFQRGELYYNDAVTQTEAQNVGELLLAEKFFNAEGAATAQLLKEGARYQLRLAVNPALVESPLLTIEVGLIASAIAQNILGGSPLEVTLVDEMLRPKKLVPLTARLEFGKSALLYAHPITVNEARRVGKQLVAATVLDLTVRGWSTWRGKRGSINCDSSSIPRVRTRPKWSPDSRSWGPWLPRRRLAESPLLCIFATGNFARYTVSALNRRRARHGSDLDD